MVALATMETQMTLNFSEVNRIKQEAVVFGLREAFLESAPQLILQISIVLRTGILSMLRTLTLVYVKTLKSKAFSDFE
jgi:XK-related protein